MTVLISHCTCEVTDHPYCIDSAVLTYTCTSNTDTSPLTSDIRTSPSYTGNVDLPGQYINTDALQHGSSVQVLKTK